MFQGIAELKDKTGLRIVSVRGVPSPWSQAAKAMIEFKELDYSIALMEPLGQNTELVQWAGVNSAPVVAWNEESPVNR